MNIPFAFAAGRMALPAGEYRVQKVAYDSSVLLIQRTDHAAATVVTSFAAQANAKQAQSKLLFHRYRKPLLPFPDLDSRLREAASNEMPEQVTIVARLIVPKPSSLPERGRQPHGNPEKPLPDSRLFLHLYASTKSAVIDKSRENIIFLRGPSTNNRGAQRQALQRP